MGAFDPQPYRTLLAEEINSMFTKIEQSSFVADFAFDAFLTQIRQTTNLQPFQLGVVAENSRW